MSSRGLKVTNKNEIDAAIKIGGVGVGGEGGLQMLIKDEEGHFERGPHPYFDPKFSLGPFDVAHEDGEIKYGAALYDEVGLGGNYTARTGDINRFVNDFQFLSNDVGRIKSDIGNTEEHLKSVQNKQQ